MLTTLAIAVFITGVLLTFSYEIKEAVKKLLAIKGMKTLLPLILVTLILVPNFFLLEAAALYLGIAVVQLGLWIAYLIPFKGGTLLGISFSLFLLAFLPMLITHYYNKHYPYDPFEYGAWVCLMIWLAGMLVFLQSGSAVV